MKLLIALFSVIFALALFAEKQPLSRYQTIIDRCPFGNLSQGGGSGSAAAGGGANASVAGKTPEQVVQEQEQLQKTVNFSAMVINNDGTVSVGFSDKTDPKNPALYYLREGETSDGWTVKSVDIEAESLVLEKDGIEITLQLGGSTAPAGGGKGKTAAAHTPTAPVRSGLLKTPSAAADGNAAMSHATRRQLREQQRQQAAAAAEKARAEQEAARKQQEEEAEAKAEAEKAAREEERAATRQQLQAIQEELRKAREEKARQKAEGDADENDQS